MGRELRRKQAKKEGKSLEKENLVEEHQIKKLLVTIFILVGILSIIYLLSALFITKELDWFTKKTEETSENSNTNIANSILASSAFSQSEEEYYVYFYDYEEKSNIITETVNSKLSDSKVYKVNTKSALNAKYISSEESSENIGIQNDEIYN